MALFDPYAKETGVILETRDAKLTSPSAEALAGFDLVDLPASLAADACRLGTIKPLDWTQLGGDAARKDFLPGTATDCAAGNTVWSALMVYAAPAFADKRQPLSVVDAFDTTRTAGKRAFPKSPRHLFELALLADGVPPAQVYRALETGAGINRVFLKLERMKADIVWWDRPADAIEMIRKGTAALALTYNGRAFFAAVRDRVPLVPVWTGQIIDANVWAIPASASPEKATAALQFIRYAIEPKRQAMQTRWFPYGPARSSAAAFVGKHAEINMEMAPYLPTTPANMKLSLPFNAAFWAVHEASLTERLQAWADGIIDWQGTPVRKPQPPGARTASGRR
jgi:putative spermidine/putrescine transport system substrate-binding protein